MGIKKDGGRKTGRRGTGDERIEMRDKGRGTRDGGRETRE